MTYQQQNPFLTNQVYNACYQARVSYLDTLARMQTNGGAPESYLTPLQEACKVHLESAMEEALRAASHGDVNTASTQLAFIVQEWGLYKAYDDLLGARRRYYIDPAHPDVVNDFDQAVQYKVVRWATELKNIMTEGDHARKADLVSQYLQMFRDQETRLHQIHQREQRYADAALRGVQQAQQGVNWMMGGVERINQQNLDNMARMNQQAGQNIYWMAQSANTLHQQAAQNIQWMQQGVQGMYNYGTQVVGETVKTQQAVTQMAGEVANATKAARKLVEQNSPVRTAVRRGGCALCLFLLFFVVLPVLGYLYLTNFVLR